MAFQKDLMLGIFSIIGGVLIHFTYGHFYTIGNLAPYVMSYLKLRVDPTVEPGSVVWISAIALAMQGVSMPIGGALLPKVGYRAVVIIGCIINSGSVLLTYLTVQKGFIYLVITYAVTLGFGFGLSYAVIFSVASSWFPNRRAFIVGLIVGGFGLGALVFTPIQTVYINPQNKTVNSTTTLFHDEALLDRVPTAFLMLGGALASLQFIGILLLNEKPKSKIEPNGTEDCQGTKNEMKSLVQSQDVEKEAYQDITSTKETNAGDTKPDVRNRCSLVQSQSHIAHFPVQSGSQHSLSHPEKINYPPLQALRRHEFYFLWIVMLCNIIPITLLTASFKLVAQEHILDDRFLTWVATASSIFNSGGRIMWGAICDKFSFKVPLCIMLLIWSATLFSFPFVVTAAKGSMVFYAIWVCLLFFCLSGVFVLMPAATGHIFGPDYLAVNYGMVFSAFSVGSIICALISETLKGHWIILYGACGGICLFALFVTFWIEDPLAMKWANIGSGLFQRLQPRVPIKKPEPSTE